MTLFCDDPKTFFKCSTYNAEHVPQHELEAMQFNALKSRFLYLRNRIVPLSVMAYQLDIDNIEALEEVVPLLFPHSFYKAYRDRYLELRDFPSMTQWLSRLTTNDLSAVMTKEFYSIDAWLEALDTETDVRVAHSSGTTGGLSLLPRGRSEVKTMHDFLRMNFAEYVDPKGERNFYQAHYNVIWPTFASGKSGVLRMADFLRDDIAGEECTFFPLINRPMSADWLYYTVKSNDTKQRGIDASINVTPYLRARLDEHNQLQHGMVQLNDTFLQCVEQEGRSKKTIFSGAPLSLYQIAREGLARGMDSMFTPDSVINTYGGSKGHGIPHDLDDVITKFTGADTFVRTYAMSELSGTFNACEHGRYHCPPWIIPFVLDKDSGAALPRQGAQHGRAAYFDLIAQTYWGGFVTADLVDISWSPCVCGRTTPHIGPDISRSDDKHHLIGAAPAQVIEAALGALRG